MKKILLVIAAILTSVNIFAQDIPEPEFIGEVIIYNSAGQWRILPKERGFMKTSASASAYLFGVGKATARLVLSGSYSEMQIPNNDTYGFIIKAENNNYDPSSIVKLVQFECTNSERRSDLASAHTLGDLESNLSTYVPFRAKKYGESSYHIVAPLEVGEYGFIVDSNDDVNRIVATFSVYDAELNKAYKKELEQQKKKQAEKEAAQQAKIDEKIEKKEARRGKK